MTEAVRPGHHSGWLLSGNPTTQWKPGRSGNPAGWPSSWTEAAMTRLRALWLTDLTLRQIAEALSIEHGHKWSEQSIGWKADKLGLPRRTIPTTWTKGMEDRLSSLWRDEIRVLEILERINAEFGTKFTKNSIIGKAHRLKLEHHRLANKSSTNLQERLARKKLSLQERREKRKDYQREWDRKNRGASNQRTAARELAPNIEDCAIPTPQRKTIYELAEHDCRWPVGDPQSDMFFFCGAVAETDRPYCSNHCRRAYEETRHRN